jgi:hypothetical protein
LNFFIVYSIDAPTDELTTWQPPKKLKQTAAYKKAHMVSRRYAGLLNKDEFNKFVKSKGLIMTPHNTMGSMTDEGWLPAMEFLNKENVNIFAYVTPLPEVEQRKKQTKARSDRLWARLKTAMLGIYGVKTDLIY